GTGSLVVREWVGVVAVLIEEAPVGVGRRHLLGAADSTVAAFLSWREDDLGAEHFQHLPALARNAGRHQDLDRVALHLGDRRKRDSGVAARRLEDRLARLQTATLLG